MKGNRCWFSGLRAFRSVQSLGVLVAFAALGASAEEAASGLRQVNRLGPDDQISIQVRDMAEVSDKALRIGANGSFTLPVVGRVRATGLTPEELEADLAERLKPYVRNPEVTVTVVEYQSRPVSVLGAVNHPGVQQVHGPRTLIEVLSLAGGLSDDAGYSIQVVRQSEWGSIPVPGAATDETGRYTAEIPIEGLLKARDPKLNLQVLPTDVITVPRARLVYVMGAVGKPGGFALKERQTITLMQALALAQGMTPVASPQNARILKPGGSSTEVRVPLERILAGKEKDRELASDEILYVPRSGAKVAAMRSVEAAIQIGTGVAIFK